MRYRSTVLQPTSDQSLIIHQNISSRVIQYKQQDFPAHNMKFPKMVEEMLKEF